jgi:hypothetical protein
VTCQPDHSTYFTSTERSRGDTHGRFQCSAERSSPGRCPAGPGYRSSTTSSPRTGLAERADSAWHSGARVCASAPLRGPCRLRTCPGRCTCCRWLPVAVAGGHSRMAHSAGTSRGMGRRARQHDRRSRRHCAGR